MRRAIAERLRSASSSAFDFSRVTNQPLKSNADAKQAERLSDQGPPRAHEFRDRASRFIAEITERAIFSDFITSTWLSMAPVSNVNSAIDADNAFLSFWLSIKMSVVAVYCGTAVMV